LTVCEFTTIIAIIKTENGEQKMATNIKDLALSIQDFVVNYRRDMHRHPELSGEEIRTTERICEELEKMNVPYKKMDPTGVLAWVKGKKGDGKTVLLRGDIDALPVKEETGLEFSSVNEGKMHACGHDTHNAMLMGAVKVATMIQNEFAGTIKFIFQPMEEIGKGAKAMMANGCLEGVDYMYGIHISPKDKSGMLLSRPGPMWASAFRFKIKINGLSSHGADPKNGIDAVVAGSAVVMALQDMVAREYDPLEPMVVTVGTVNAPGRFNIIAGEYTMEGTIRTFSRKINKTLEETLNRIAKNVAAAYRCTAEVYLEEVAEVCENDEEAYEIAKRAAEKVAPGNVGTESLKMTGEDFAYYTPHVKSAFFILGAQMPDKDGKAWSLHSSHALFDEEAFPTGVAMYVQTALEALNS
jgi:amidohydrolase